MRNKKIFSFQEEARLRQQERPVRRITIGSAGAAGLQAEGGHGEATSRRDWDTGGIRLRSGGDFRERAELAGRASTEVGRNSALSPRADHGHGRPELLDPGISGAVRGDAEGHGEALSGSCSGVGPIISICFAM